MRLTKLEIRALIAAASHLENDFEQYYDYEKKSFHNAYCSGLQKLRFELGRREKLFIKNDLIINN